MDAARAGDHRERLQARVAQRRRRSQRRAAHRGEVLGRRVEVDDEPVRAVEPVGARGEHVGFTARADRLDRPDRVVIDLDPSIRGLRAVRRAAQPAATRCALAGWSRSRGHRLARHPRGRADQAHARDRGRPGLGPRLRRRARRGARRRPLTTEFYKNKRDERIYLDVARNAPSQTVVPPYAPRPRPHAPVATPLRWEELDDDALSPDGWTLRTVQARLDDLGGDPWKDINKSARALPRG